MNLRRLIVFSFLFLVLWASQPSIAEEECIIANQYPRETIQLPWDYAQLPGWAPVEWDTIDLAVHIITGTGEPGIDPNVLNAAIAQINPAYQPAMLHFQIFTTEYHFDDDFVYVADFEAPLMFNRYRISGAFNIYFVPDAGGVQPLKPLYRDSLITPENAFRFNAINVSQPGERLTVPVQIVERNLKRVSPTGSNPFSLPLLRLRLKDGNTGQVLNTVHTFQSSILGNDSTRYIAITDTFEIELNGLVNRRIQVEGATFFSLNDPEKGGPQIAAVS